MTETKTGDSDQTPKIDPAFLRCFYENQYEQRWRGSRNQDWIIVSAVASMTAAIVFLNAKLLGSDNFFVLCGMLFFPVISGLFAEVGFRVLLMHQQVMRHANHIATGIEAHFGIIEKGSATLNPEDELYVGLIKSEDGTKYFTYPTKEIFIKNKPLSYEKFDANALRAQNVQSTIGLLYRFFQGFSVIIFFVDFFVIINKIM